MRNSKNTKIVLATVLLGFAFLAGFAYESYNSYKMEINRAKVETINLSRVLEEQLNTSFTIIDMVLRELQELVQINRQKNTFTAKEFDKIFLDRRLRFSFVKSFKVVNKNGNFLADDEGVKDHLNLSDRDYFQLIKSTNTNQLVISRPVISKTSGIWVIVAARRIVDKKDNFDGVILGTIPVDYFLKQFKSLNLGEKGNVGLFDYQMVAHARYPVIEGQLGRKINVRKAYQDFFVSPESFFVSRNISPIDEVERVVTLRKLKTYKLTVMVGLSILDITYEWKKRTIIYCGSIIFLISIFIYFLFVFLKGQDDLEDQRHQAIQASKLSSLGEMASGIAHEINNPLTIISALATRTKKNLLDKSIPLETSSDNLDKIIATVDRIAKIIRGLRSFSRDSNGDSFGRKKVNEIVEMTLDLCAERLKDKGVEIQLDHLIENEIDCREVQIVQVMVNLLNNSLDAISTLDEKWIRISTWEQNEKVFIRVSDSGPGIDERIVEKMMMPFFTTKEIGKGTGLGLSISKGIIEAHNGNFFYKKFDGHTSFIIELRKNLSRA